jgi:HEPN pEK499 p136
MGMPTKPLLDIMHRTMENLIFIEMHAKPEGPYEVTQLINSFLGALAHPWEAFRADLNSLPIAKASEQGWPAISTLEGIDSDPPTLGKLIAVLRHSLVHGNIEYIPDSAGNISALRVRNFDNSRKVVRWEAIIKISDLRHFLTCFVDLIETRHKDSGSNELSAA